MSFLSKPCPSEATRHDFDSGRYWRIKILLEYFRFAVDVLIRVAAEALRIWTN
ncbi:hypothetical protein [Actinomadura napierensis]|uniref:Transposase n=1 Tax=Actinomadura napierensis TaxID=267854 RepID=A0ABN3AHZ6_9ACTN